MDNVSFLLGADDMEMSAIESLLREHGVEFRHAHAFNPATRAVERCHAGNAYKAVDGICPSTGAGIPDITRVVMVECGIEGIEPLYRIDHHNPGDPGFGLGPADYWLGSSLGQVVEYLIQMGKPVVITEELRFIAAGDHCPAHAYQGQCPGVDPEALMRFRASRKAAFQGKTLEDLLTEIEIGKQKLLQAPRMNLAGIDVALTGDDPIAQLPEICIIVGLAAEYVLLDRGGRQKVGLIGSAEPAVIQEWMDAAPGRGLVDVYGSPQRGYCGAYRPEVHEG